MPYFVIAGLLVATSAPAHAYIDAGSGSYMLQMSIAGIMALVFSIKLSWQRLKSYVAARLTTNVRPGSRGQA